MHTPLCAQLDDYLGDWLPQSERSEFEAHLTACQQCRRAVGLQRRMDRLLARGVEQGERVPPALITAVETRIHLWRRRRARQLAWGASAVVALALLVGVWSAVQRPEPLVADHREPVTVPEHEGPPALLASQPDQAAHVTLADRSAGILVPVHTDDPNVSIVWVYPTKTAGENSRYKVN